MKRVVVCFVVLLLGGSIALAQLPTGTILGVVKDSSGASVPNAKVTARNTDTNQSRTVVTGDDGAYRMEAMAVGNYQITSEATGFKTEVQSGLTLTVAQEAAVNFSLQIGETSQTVSVTTEAPLVSTTTSSLGGLVDDARIVDLPLNGRNYNDLTLLQPGVSMSTSSGSASLGWSGTQFSSNGAPIRSNTYMLDGAILNNILSTNGSSATGTTLGVDGIQEYRVITSNFTAEYGMTMGSQQTIVSKSGTNQFHGDVFEFIRNSSLDARNFFDLQPSRLGHRLPPFRRNNFGGAVGGPILKDKTFFFADYEGLRSSFGTTNTVTTLWPTCQVPAGTTEIWNGLGTQPAGSAGDCPQLGGTSASPPFPVAAQMIPIEQLYPSPNLCTPDVTKPTLCVSNNYGFVFQQVITENYGQIRVDHTLSANDNLFGRYTVDQASLPQVGNFNESYSLVESRNQFLTLAENHIFSTSLLNSARFSFSRTPLTILNPLLDPRLGTTPYEIGTGIQMGPISVGGGVSSIGTNSLSPRIFKQNIFTYADDLNYTRGKHSLKFGFILNHYQDQLSVHGYDKGVIAFSSLANFFNANMSSIAIVEPGGNVNKYFKFDTMGFYAQDAWRVTPRLTLNLGLRYEPTTSLDEIYGRSSALVNPATDPAFTVGVPPFKNPSLRNWSPRVGFAWDIFGNGKTALRGGFGEMYDQSTYGSALSVLAGYNPPFSPTYSATAGTLMFPFTIPANSFALGAEGPSYNMRQPHLLSYNLAVERQLPGSMSITLAYVGSRGINLVQLNDGNPEIPNGVPSGTGAAQTCVQGSGPINFASQFDGGSATSCYYLNPGVIGAACTFQGFSSPCNLPPPRRNGQFGSFAYLFASGDSLYNGMQLSVNKRLSKGLQVQAAYTWSKLQDDNQGQTTGDPTSEFIEPNNEHSRWGASDLDITNNLRVSAIYYFPNYKSSHEFVNKLTNGWWTSGILAAQTGYPFTVLVSGFRSEDGTISIFGGTPDVPDLSLNATTYNLTHGISSGCGTGSGIVPAGTPLGTTAPGRWYDPCAFSIPAQGFIGNERRNILRGPGQNYLNFSLVKDTKVGFLGEAGSVQFRAEFFNFLNHPSFSNPTAAVATGSCGTGVLTGCGFSGTGGNPSSTAGLLSATSVQPRNIQFGLKIVF